MLLAFRSILAFAPTRGGVRTWVAVAFFALLIVGSWSAVGAEPTGQAAPPAVHAEEDSAATTPAHDADAHPEKHVLSLYAVPLVTLGPFAVTNSMLVTWIVAILIIVFAQYATRNIQEVPSGAQNFWEWLVEGLYSFLENIIGHALAKKTFWFFASIFIFILFTNWFGLLPGVGTIGWGHANASGGLDHISHPLLRGANADLNMTFAMAAVFFVCWFVWALQANGPGGFLMHLFGPKGDTTGALRILMIVIFFVVGCLEVVSILFRPISLSFRLFGNIYAGEIMLESMANVIQQPVWLRMITSPLIPIPFYFLELLVGFVQALVFMLLTAVFTLLIAAHEPGHDAHH